jgi:hypothetical protein
MSYKSLLTGLFIATGSLNVLATDEFMTGAELTSLVGQGKTINLGGESEGYSGTLEIKADGTASGSAKTAAGKKIVIKGTWAIEGDQFCRTWKGLDGGKKFCETWKKIGDNKVEVLEIKKLGVNWW